MSENTFTIKLSVIMMSASLFIILVLFDSRPIHPRTEMVQYELWFDFVIINTIDTTGWTITHVTLDFGVSHVVMWF